MDESRKNLVYGILAIIGGTLIHFTFGYFYTIANMIPYMYSYLKARVDPTIEEKTLLWMSSIALGVQGISMPLGGLLAKKLGFRIVVGMSCLFDCGSVLLTYFSIKHSFALVVVTYSLILGAGLGFGYSVVLATAGTWFPARRGLVVGIIVGGFGIGALVFTPIQTALINPNNIKVNEKTRAFEDDDLLDRLPRAFLILGLILFVIQVIGLALLRPKPKDPELPETNVKGDEPGPETHLVEKGQVEKALAARQDSNPAAGDYKTWSAGDDPTFESDPKKLDDDDKAEVEVNLGPAKVLRSIDFYLLWTVMFCNIIPITVITASYKLFGQRYISDDIFLSGVATVSSIFNAGGRIVWGAIVDRCSFKIPLCVMFVLWASLLVTFPHLSLLTGTTLKTLYAIWICLMFFSLSGVFAIMPAATSIVFGSVNMAVNYGLIFNAFFAGSLTISIISTFAFGKHAYLELYTLCACICIFALFTILWVYDRRISPRFNWCRWCAGSCFKLRHAHDPDSSYELHARD